MKLRVLSDLHSEFLAKDLHRIDRIVLNALPKLEGDAETILILAGDIGSMHKPACLRAVIEAVAPRFKHVFYVAGNHEYYGGSLKDTPKDIELIVKDFPNVAFKTNGLCKAMDHKTSEIKRFLLTTLWTDFSKGNPVSMYYAEKGMNDYRACKGFDGKVMLPQDTFRLHLKAKKDLEEGIKEGDIIVTHHLPSFKSVDPQFKDSPLNDAYASDLESLILEKKPKLWIHGHTHAPCDYMIGSTRVICNPRGYAGQENNGYNPTLVIEV